MNLLEYENQLFLELFQEDSLLVLGKGLGVERLLINLIRTYSDPGNLVLVIGTNSSEEEYLINKITDLNITHLPKVITSEISTKERYEVYMQGGVLFVSTRILVVDMLVERIPIELITGIIVYRAHKILESCQEAFSIRLYRMKNKKGFIKAISSNPCAFTRGFTQIQRIMRNLFVGKLSLWPRFHALISSSMEKVKPEVQELHVSMTPAMQAIQIAVLDLINVTVRELKKMNPTLDTDEMTVENAIAKSFDKLIKYQLDPVWHQLSSKTRRLVADLKFLRSVLRYLTQHDCVTFYSLLKSIKDNVTIGTHMSDWLFLDASETVFLHARERLYGRSDKKKKLKRNDGENDCPMSFEPNPKWNAVSEVLDEISKEIDDDKKEMVLIVVEDEVISRQLNTVLTHGAQSYLYRLFRKLQKKGSIVSSKTSHISRSNAIDDDEQTLTQMASNKNCAVDNDSENVDANVCIDIGDDSDDDCDKTDKSDDNILLKCSNLLVEFYPLRHGSGSHYRFQQIMELHNLKYIILYDGDMEIIRRIELHQSLNSSSKLKVYFLVYSGSAEEQCYLTTLRREKEAFEYLIKEKAQMALPDDIDGKSEDHPDLVRGSSAANETIDSRKAGGQQPQSVEVQKVIVDMREFRSELPSLIHRRGIDVIPVTLEIGDYVLTPEICVERKSVSDLIGSLNSGRLYTQAQAMCRAYKRPILLIEFDQNKAFSLQGKYYAGQSAPQSITSKLILLTCHFPQLRILWCTSPYATAEMFELLKCKREQPNVEQAMLLKHEGSEGDASTDKYNNVACELISKLPGLNSKNMWPLMNKMNSISDIVKYSEEELSNILQNSIAAKTLWNSIHLEMKGDAEAQAVSKKPKKQWRSNKKKAM